MSSMAVIGICRRRNSSREPPEIFACLRLSKTVTCMVKACYSDNAVRPQ